MFDKLIELFTRWWLDIAPFVIVKEWEEGIVLRWGRYNRILKPGIHFKIPVVDEAIIQHVVVTTLSLSTQSLYTLDKQNIVVKGIIKYKIGDVKVFLLEVFDAKDAVADMTESIMKSIIMSKSLEECINPDIDNQITKKARIEAKKWGVDIQQVTLIDIAPIKTFRLMNDTISNKID